MKKKETEAKRVLYEHAPKLAPIPKLVIIIIHHDTKKGLNNVGMRAIFWCMLIPNNRFGFPFQ